MLLQSTTNVNKNSVQRQHSTYSQTNTLSSGVLLLIIIIIMLTEYDFVLNDRVEFTALLSVGKKSLDVFLM